MRNRQLGAHNRNNTTDRVRSANIFVLSVTTMELLALENWTNWWQREFSRYPGNSLSADRPVQLSVSDQYSFMRILCDSSENCYRFLSCWENRILSKSILGERGWIDLNISSGKSSTLICTSLHKTASSELSILCIRISQPEPRVRKKRQFKIWNSVRHLNRTFYACMERHLSVGTRWSLANG
jgi:hypothetical protein